MLGIAVSKTGPHITRFLCPKMNSRKSTAAGSGDQVGVIAIPVTPNAMSFDDNLSVQQISRADALLRNSLIEFPRLVSLPSNHYDEATHIQETRRAAGC